MVASPYFLMLVQVENQSGLSNFIPIFFGDKETCEEIEILQRTCDTPKASSQEQPTSPPRPACGVLALRQTRFSGFLLDLGWSLKKPVSEKILTSSDVQRFDYLLDFLIKKRSSVILERVFSSLESSIDKNDVAGVSDSDIRSLRAKMGIARCMLDHRSSQKVDRFVQATKMVWPPNVYTLYWESILWFTMFAIYPIYEIWVFIYVKLVHQKFIWMKFEKLTCFGKMRMIRNWKKKIV